MGFKLVRTEKQSFLRRVIKSSIRSVMLYTVASFVMIWMTGNQPPDALTIAFFAYWSFENGAAALIQTVTKKNKKDEDEPVEGEDNYEN